ncbi:MAG: Crp/Fnr family transcriptional regulator [Methylovulum sp.]|jgi:CRP/FNR family cyclic AMP-dependent transcriptional regulator
MINLTELLLDPDFIDNVPFKIIQYQATDVILAENETSQEVFFILNGVVQVSLLINDDQGRLLHNLARLAKNDIFGELSMFDGEPRSAEVIACSQCEIAKVDGKAMLNFMEKFPDRGYFILREMYMNLITRMRKSNIRTKEVLDLFLQKRS